MGADGGVEGVWVGDGGESAGVFVGAKNARTCPSLALDLSIDLSA